MIAMLVLLSCMPGCMQNGILEDRGSSYRGEKYPFLVTDFKLENMDENSGRLFNEELNRILLEMGFPMMSGEVMEKITGNPELIEKSSKSFSYALLLAQKVNIKVLITGEVGIGEDGRLFTNLHFYNIDGDREAGSGTKFALKDQYGASDIKDIAKSTARSIYVRYANRLPRYRNKILVMSLLGQDVDELELLDATDKLVEKLKSYEICEIITNDNADRRARERLKREEEGGRRNIIISPSGNELYSSYARTGKCGKVIHGQIHLYGSRYYGEIALYDAYREKELCRVKKRSTFSMSLNDFILEFAPELLRQGLYSGKIFDVKIYINKAPLHALALLPDIDNNKAKLIVDHRKDTGPIENDSEFMNCTRLSPKAFDKIKRYIDFTADDSEEPAVKEDMSY